MIKLKSTMATIMVLIIIFATQALGSSSTDEYPLKKNTWDSYLCYKSTDTDKYDYRLINVRPDDGKEDTYSRMKLGVMDEDDNWIMEEIVVTEDAFRTISYYYGNKYNLSARDVLFITMRGNNPSLGAWAELYQNWY